MPNGVADKVYKPVETETGNTSDKPFLLSIDHASLLPATEVAERFETNVSTGLDQAEAEARLQRFGSNELAKKAPVNPLQLFCAQFMSTVVLLLLAAAGVSAMGGEYLQALGIAVAVLINAVVGFNTLANYEKLTEG